VEIIGVGDAILNRRLSRLGDTAFDAVVELTRSADAAYVNFEMVTPTLPAVPSPTPIALRLAAPSWTLEELAWMGFDLFGIANNHGFDYGSDGILHTVEQLERRGLAFAGAGRNLDTARMPFFHDTPAGRIALICATSSGAELSLASNGRGVIASRPGTNPLRYTTEYHVTEEIFEQVKDIDTALGSAETNRLLLGLGVFPGFHNHDPSIYRFLGRRFVVDDSTGIVTTPLAEDIDEISRWIDEAKRSADLVVVGLHCHEGAADGWNIEPAAEFVPVSARAFVDAGADIVFGHGPHRLRGIEMYREKPIFYSLGNFLFLDESISVVDPEQFSLFGLDRASTPADLHDWRAEWPDGRPRGFHSQQAYWDSVVAKCRFDGRRCTGVELYPVELGLHRPRTARGLPNLASGDTGRRVLSELARMSKDEYGTAIDITPSGDGYVGVISGTTR
jgi:hypothetical protein